MLYRKPNNITGNTFTTLLKIQHYRNHHNITGSKKTLQEIENYRPHNNITENTILSQKTEQYCRTHNETGRNPRTTEKSLLTTQHYNKTITENTALSTT